MTQPQQPAKVDYKRIATEEAFCPVEMLDIWKRILNGPDPDPGFVSLIGFYMSSQSARARHIMECLTDLGEKRLRHMDETGIDRQIIALTSPGVQVMESESAVAFAKVANDELAEACKRHPTRFSGMVAIAPQNPREAAKEIERGVKQLGLTGVIINSHTQGEYLSDPKFWEIFEAAEANDTPIYLHPNTPPRNMIQPFVECGLDGAIYGFGVETGLHALRIITAGVFDRFPKLQLILGHLGETLPFMIRRVDNMNPGMTGLKKPISGYLRENFHYTFSGFNFAPAFLALLLEVGIDRIMFSADHPYASMVAARSFLNQLPVSPTDKERIAHGNAETTADFRKFFNCTQAFFCFIAELIRRRRNQITE